MTRAADLLDSELVAELAEALVKAAPSPHEDLERRQLVSTLLRTLSPRLERLIRLYYGIGVPQAGAREIADGFEITRTRINMMHREALRRMRMAGKYIDAAEPELTADRAYPLPRGWAMPGLQSQNARFVARLNEARGLSAAPARKRKVSKKQKPHLCKTPGPEPLGAPSPACPGQVPDAIHRAAYMDGILSAGQVFVLPAGLGVVVAGAEYGGFVGLLAGCIAMPVMAIGYYYWINRRSKAH